MGVRASGALASGGAASLVKGGGVAWWILLGAFLLAAAASFGLVEAVRRWVLRRSVLDIPNARSSHTDPTPRGGGLAVVAVVVAGVAAAAGGGLLRVQSGLLFCAAGALLVALVSWGDDVSRLPVAARLLVHVSAAVLAVAGAGWWRVPGLPHATTVADAAAVGLLALVWIVGLTNAYNFMDGIDGIAGSQAVVAGLGWVALTWGSGRVEMWLGLLLAAASLGFLAHNWSPAKIFMGDVGSAFLGFAFAALALIGAQHDPRLAIAGALLVWPFVYDTSFTFLRRLRRGENVFQAHRSHLYQRLVLAGYSHRFVTCLYGAFAFLGVVLALVWARRLAEASWLVPSGLAAAMVGLWLFVAGTERRRRPSRPVLVTPRRTQGGLWFVGFVAAGC